MRRNAKVTFAFILNLILSLGPPQALAAPDLEKAEQLSSSLCIACHGPQGRSTNPAWPNLYGQKDLYMIEQIKLFKSGARKNELMSPIAAILSDEDSESLAAYFSQFEQKAAPTTETTK